MLRFSKEIIGTRDSDNYATPKRFYKKIDDEFLFDLDPCPLNSTTNGLAIKWHGNVYINPPFSRIAPFIEKAINELRSGNANLCVFLLPIRSDTKYFHDLILPLCREIRFVKGRLNFNESKSPAPFPCAIVIFDKHLSGECIVSGYSKHNTTNDTTTGN